MVNVGKYTSPMDPMGNRILENVYIYIYPRKSKSIKLCPGW